MNMGSFSLLQSNLLETTIVGGFDPSVFARFGVRNVCICIGITDH